MPRISHRSSPEILKSPFTIAVLKMVRAIPRGKVASYGQIAELSGKPHGSRGVAWILHASRREEDVPWQRVIGSAGDIRFPKRRKEFKEQAQLLREEGVDVSPAGKIDMTIYRWNKKPKAVISKGSKGTPQMFS